MKKFLYWAPRFLGIIMVCFISLFAFDVFEEGQTAWETALALFMHLLPSIAGIILIIVAWKRELIGGWLFIAFSAVFVFIAKFELVGILAIALPFAIIGALYIVHYYKYVKQGQPPAVKSASQPPMQP
ncbi:MAG: hypothetical protein PHY34_06155 [Patescibacteria group bacterium]|nr:hypothetical protein [Patescibacteria group bacterium]MDD5715779.1 hypothetical protein [Patescibacteria group bacterium]